MESWRASLLLPWSVDEVNTLTCKVTESIRNKMCVCVCLFGRCVKKMGSSCKRVTSVEDVIPSDNICTFV